jgi:probable biosynthetic protein (TIGR04098 family)
MDTVAWSDLGVDSFALLVLRSALEEALGHPIDDGRWASFDGPSALMALGDAPAEAGTTSHQPFVRHERVEIGMPQMAARGLAEDWLLKTLGDLHWRSLADALGTSAAEIVDGEGRRLYAAFNRVRIASSAPLADYREGECLTIETRLSRFGSGLFLSEAEFSGADGRRGSARLMSSFIYREPGVARNALRRGQPDLPASCAIPKYSELPAFAKEYQEERAVIGAGRPVIRSAAYDLMPERDINGVGLLYFAVYPVISEICEGRLIPPEERLARVGRTQVRDIFYFANADAGSQIEWRLHLDDGRCSEATLVRDDGVAMALIRTERGES